MRTALPLLAVFALARASAQAGLVVNDVVDQMLIRVSNNLNMSRLPDIAYTGAVRQQSATIRGDNGILVGRVALKRFGNATLGYGESHPRLDVEVGFDQLELRYGYGTEVGSKKGPSGLFTATVGPTSVLATVDVMFDDTLCNVQASLDAGRMGEITVEHSGSNAVNALFHDLIVGMLTKARLFYLDKANEAVSLGFDCNKILPAILAPIS